MKKNFFHCLLMAVLCCGLSMSFVACSDDDDDKDGRSAEEIAQDPFEKESEAGNALYRLLSQLSVCDSLPDNWKTATFEPKAGMVLDQSQPRIRTITVTNAEEAITRYNSLTGKDLPVTTTSDTYAVDGVGKLTFTAGEGGTIATIDVDVKQIPQLQKLRFVTAASIGENGHFSGEPYYRFGDVVKDNDGCYWVCVRPAYSDDKKEDTHWFSFHMANENMKYLDKYNRIHSYPVKLGVEKTKMQYLAQLLAILANPQRYSTLVGNKGNYFNNGTTGLGGLKEAAMPVDSLMKQADLWKQYKVWEMVMPRGYDEDGLTYNTEAFKKRFTQSVTFIYEKASLSGSNLTVPIVTYGGAENFYVNPPTYAKPVVNLKYTCFDGVSYWAKGVFKDENDGTVPDAFVVRYKSGYQLSSNLIFSPKATEAIPGVETVYRFNEHKNENKTTYDIKEARVGMAFGKDGKLYGDYNAVRKATNANPVAVVCYVGNDADDSGQYQGLAMSASIVKEHYNFGNLVWSDYTDGTCTANPGNGTQSWTDQMNGLANTKRLVEDEHNHWAAQAANDYDEESEFQPTNFGFSRWFLPSGGQLARGYAAIGNGKTLRGGTVKCPDFSTVFKKATNNEIRNIVWTSSEENSGAAVRCSSPHEGACLLEPFTKSWGHTQNVEVLPFFAF